MEDRSGVCFPGQCSVFRLGQRRDEFWTVPKVEWGSLVTSDCRRVRTGEGGNGRAEVEDPWGWCTTGTRRTTRDLSDPKDVNDEEKGSYKKGSIGALRKGGRRFSKDWCTL